MRFAKLTRLSNNDIVSLFPAVPDLTAMVEKVKPFVRPAIVTSKSL
jgi:hypothetical protein